MTTGLYIAMSFKPSIGGIQEQTHQTTRHLIELGESIYVLARQVQGDSEFDKSCGYPVTRFRSNIGTGRGWQHPWNRSSLLREIITAIRNINPDYIILDVYQGLLSGLSVVAASYLTRVPFFLFAHGSEFSQPIRLKSFRKLTVRSAARIICVSSYLRSLVLAGGVNPDKVVTIPNGFDYREIEAYQVRNYKNRFPSLDIAFSDKGPILLTVSRIMERKGIDKIIKAMPKITSEIPGAHYMIVGEGPSMDSHKRLADMSPAKDSITFLGPLVGDEKFECYSRCELFVMPSYEDSFPVVFPEANAFGKPVIGGSSGGVPDAITHGYNGLLVDPHNIDEIADAIIRLLKDPNEARRLGANGRRRVTDELSWEAQAIKLLSLIHETIQEPK